MESAKAQLSVYGSDYELSGLTSPNDGENSFKLSEIPNSRIEFPSGATISNFTVHLVITPKEPVSEDIVVQWDFTFKYQTSTDY
jgi:hypothetical protein